MIRRLKAEASETRRSRPSGTKSSVFHTFKISFWTFKRQYALLRKSGKPWMSTASVQRQVDRRIYRLWRWQISGRRRTRREGVPIRKTPPITTFPSIILVPREGSAPPSSTCMNGTAPHPTWKALRTLKSSFWISMITTCWSPSTRSWGHRWSPSVSPADSFLQIHALALQFRCLRISILTVWCLWKILLHSADQ